MTAIAALDCGTHSTRLLIAESQPPGPPPGQPPDQPRTLAREMTITNLGEDLADTGQLKPEAIQRTARCLSNYAEQMKHHNVQAFRVVATSAARDASNTQELFDTIAQITGQPPELLSGEAEAKLSFRGAASQLDPAAGPYLVCDIGGGSTEFALGAGGGGDAGESALGAGGGGDAAECQGVWSADIGSSRLTQKYISHDPPQPEELSACLSIITEHLKDLERAVPAVGQARQLVGLAGTVTTAAAVELGLAEYDPERLHHFLLEKPAAEDVFRTLATENRQQRLANPGLDPERVDVIVGGLCILVQVMRYFGFESCLVSEADLLDGIIAEIARN